MESVLRIILSRKGFDSQYGGVPSPILPDGSLAPLPIGDNRSVVSYGDIQRRGHCLGDLAEQMTRGRVCRDHRAHLDPDLDENALPRHPDWRPSFGQEGSSLGHLRNQGVSAGDLFLFFGWFRATEVRRGTLVYQRNARPVHLIWGWLRIGEHYDCPDLPTPLRTWAAHHPHLQPNRAEPNTLFIAADTIELGGRSLPGAGIFPCQTASRTLTENNDALSRWRLPAWMHPKTLQATLSYHQDPDRWFERDADWCALQSVGKGQEFVLTAQDPTLPQRWLTQLFADL